MSMVEFCPLQSFKAQPESSAFLANACRGVDLSCPDLADLPQPSPNRPCVLIPPPQPLHPPLHTSTHSSIKCASQSIGFGDEKNWEDFSSSSNQTQVDLSQKSTNVTLRSCWFRWCHCVSVISHCRCSYWQQMHPPREKTSTFRDVIPALPQPLSKLLTQHLWGFFCHGGSHFPAEPHENSPNRPAGTNYQTLTRASFSLITRCLNGLTHFTP